MGTIPKALLQRHFVPYYWTNSPIILGALGALLDDIDFEAMAYFVLARLSPHPSNQSQVNIHVDVCLG